MQAPAFADPEMRIASPPLSYYAPVPTYHDHIYRRLGVILSYMVGPDYSQAIIDDNDSREWEMIVSGNFNMEGRELKCEEAPQDAQTPASVLCPDWPDDIVLYETPIFFTYWVTRLDGHEIAVLQSIVRQEQQRIKRFRLPASLWNGLEFRLNTIETRLR